MDEASTRRRMLRDRIDKFLKELGLSHGLLAPATQHHLYEWARQVDVVLNQPSANYENAILGLIKAIESELASRLGFITGLGFMAESMALGDRARRLSGLQLDESVKQKLRSAGIKPGFIELTLQQRLGSLARIRRETGSAHGGLQIQSATEDDALQAQCLVGDILKGIVPISGSK